MTVKFLSTQTFEMTPDVIRVTSPIFTEYVRISNTVPMFMSIGPNPDPRTGAPMVVPANTIQDVYIENRGDKVALLLIENPGIDSTVQTGWASVTIIEVV